MIRQLTRFLASGYCLMRFLAMSGRHEFHANALSRLQRVWLSASAQ
jgi:hypothetical protein